MDLGTLIAIPFVLLQTSIIPTLILLPVAIIGFKLAKYLEKRYDTWSWITTRFIATYIMSALAATILFFAPLVLAPPETTQASNIQVIIPWYGIIINTLLTEGIVLLKAVALATIVTPFIFIGSAVFEWARNKLNWNSTLAWLIYLAIATYVCTYIFNAATYLLPWLYPGLVNFLYYT